MGDDGFQVTEEVVVGDLSDVVEQRQVVPAASNVKVRIAKIAVMDNKDKDLKGLSGEFRIVDGIEKVDPETGESKLAYVNKPMFTGIMELCFWANPETRTKPYFKSKQHLVQFKKFIQAIGEDITNVKINDDWLLSLVGREVGVDIQVEDETAVNEEGKRVKTGTQRNRLRNWKALA